MTCGRQSRPARTRSTSSVPKADEHAFDFDLLDATKISPEELVPVRQALARDGYALHFVAEAVKHGKVMVGLGEGAEPIERATFGAVSLRGASQLSGQPDDQRPYVVDHGLFGVSANPELPGGFVDEFCQLRAGGG